MTWLSGRQSAEEDIENAVMLETRLPGEFKVVGTDVGDAGVDAAEG